MLKLLGLLIGLPVVAIALFYVWATAANSDPQDYAAIVNYPPAGVDESEEKREAADDAIYTIVSYNIGYLSGLANNTTIEADQSFFDANQARAIAALQALNPDIIGFQEIDFGSKRSYGVNQAEAIAQALKLYTGALAVNWDKNYVPFPYWPITAHFGKLLSGQAILSRHPIEKNSRLILERVAGKPFFYRAFYLDRLAQVSQISLNGQPIIVINAHLEAFVESTRINQTQFVRELAEDYAQSYPVIVMGDFNSSPNRAEEQSEASDFSIEVMASSEQFTSAVAKSDWNQTPTFPSDELLYKLDYIFYTPNTLEMLETQVVSAAGKSSDHLPLMMRFKLKP
ncbi:MAG: endonuclease/exonuclease/phosphatase family protein [Phormidesmis sp.]